MLLLAKRDRNRAVMKFTNRAVCFETNSMAATKKNLAFMEQKVNIERRHKFHHATHINHFHWKSKLKLIREIIIGNWHLCFGGLLLLVDCGLQLPRVVMLMTDEIANQQQSNRQDRKAALLLRCCCRSTAQSLIIINIAKCSIFMFTKVSKLSRQGLAKGWLKGNCERCAQKGKTTINFRKVR